MMLRWRLREQVLDGAMRADGKVEEHAVTMAAGMSSRGGGRWTTRLLGGGGWRTTRSVVVATEDNDDGWDLTTTTMATARRRRRRRRPTTMATARRANEDDGDDEIGRRTTCKWETNALSKIILTLLYYALITERLSLFYFGKRCLLDQTGTGHQKASPRKQNPY
jgi:hypothetical protein